MKKYGIFAVIVIVIAATIGFSACKRKNEQTHEHNYAWVDNGDGTHKQHCSVDGCDEPDIEIGSHEYNEDGVCVCGARKPDEHKHAYVRKVAESKYLKSAATCQSKAVYYYSCECGEKGSETFGYGDLADHTGGTATCNKRAVCEVCGKEYGGFAEHSYVQKVTTERYLKSVATCQSKAVYYYSCVCGMTGTATFEYGESADHDYGELIYGYSADCENDGVKNHYRCSVCEKDFDENKQELSSLVIPAAHEFEGWKDEIAATCSKTGVRGHNHCNVCGKDFGADGNEIGSLIIKANGHNIENGKCTVCGMPEPTGGIEYVSYTDDPETYMVVGYDSTTEAKNVTSIVISDVINGYTVTKIRRDAFRYCSALTSVTIPASITCIDSNAFYGCSELANINYLGDLAEWNRIEGLEYLMTRGKTDKTVTIGGKEVAGDLVIPDGVVSVADYAFYKCGKLTSMVIPDSVRTIGEGAFYGCSELTSVNIPKGVTSIGEINFGGADGMFYGCVKLTSIIIPDGVTCIGNDSFRECSGLTSVSIPDSVTKIGAGAFAGCSSLTEIKIPDGVTDIYTDAFSDCSNLASINIPDGITNIQGGLFSGCGSLTEIKIPDGVTVIGSAAFRKCVSITSIKIPDGVTSIEAETFIDCENLTSVEIPVGVTQIGSNAFSGCISLEEVIIPNSVTAIYYAAFSGCKSLKSIVIPDSVEGSLRQTFKDCVSLKKAVIGANVTEILSEAFMNCEKLESVNIPEKVTVIGDSVFGGCVNLTTVTIPDSVTAIYGSAFYKCSGLTSVTIGKGMTEIYANAFQFCVGLSSVTIPASVTSIGYGAFDDCHAIIYCEAAEKPSGWNVSWMGECVVVWDCKNNDKDSEGYVHTVVDGLRYKIKDGVAAVGQQSLTLSGEAVILSEITYNGETYKVTSVGEGAFKNCEKVTKIVVPEGVTLISTSAFFGCGATSMVIPKSLTTIQTNSFPSKLKEVYYGGSYEYEWNKISGVRWVDTTRITLYYYSETEPTNDGNYWHYVDDEVVVWGKEA